VSPDGNYSFYQTAGNDPKILRMGVKDRGAGEAASLKGFQPADDP